MNEKVGAPVRAYVFVSTTNPGPRTACLAIRAVPGVVHADALFGGPPVIALVEGADLAALDAVVDAIVELPMVTDTETHIVRPIG
jgi:DNA-binding Lrp family transcriptional regulator